MIRTSKHNISNITNISKVYSLDNLFNDYKHDLLIYIDLMLDGTLPIKINLSSSLLPNNIISHSRYKQIIYKQASEIIRSQLDQANNRRYNRFKSIYSYFIRNNRQSKFTNKRFSELNLKPIVKSKYFTKPKLNNLSINLDERVFNVFKGNYFDNFINLILPYFNEKGTRALKVNLPLTHHRHSKYFINNGFILKNNIQIKKENGNYFISLIWFKEDPIKRTEGASIGIDTGYRKLIVTSENQRLGCDEMIKIYSSIVNKKRNSKNYKKLLAYRDNLVNMYVNQIDIKDVKTIIIEDLNNVKYKSKFGNKINDKVSRWVYRKLIDKIKRMCEDKGIMLVNVSPAYTSQTCSLCGSVHKDNRRGDLFKCIECGYEIDADYNASINIRNRGAIVPLPNKLHYNSL